MISIGKITTILSKNRFVTQMNDCFLVGVKNEKKRKENFFKKKIL